MFGFSRFMMDMMKIKFADIRGLYQKEGTLKNLAVYQIHMPLLGYLTNKDFATNGRFERTNPAIIKSIVTSCGDLQKEGLKEVSVSEAHVENFLTKNGDKYNNYSRGTPVKFRMAVIFLNQTSCTFVEIPERQAGSVIKSKSAGRRSSYPYENRFRENQYGWLE